MDVTSTLLQYILNLMSDPEALEEFNADPEAAMALAGLSGVSCGDVDDVMPLVADSVFVDQGAKVLTYAGGGNVGSGGSSHHHDHSAAVAQISNVVNNTTVYDNDVFINDSFNSTFIDDSVDNSITTGDIEGDGVAVGDGAAATSASGDNAQAATVNNSGNGGDGGAGGAGGDSGDSTGGAGGTSTGGAGGAATSGDADGGGVTAEGGLLGVAIPVQAAIPISVLGDAESEQSIGGAESGDADGGPGGDGGNAPGGDGDETGAGGDGGRGGEAGDGGDIDIDFGRSGDNIEENGEGDLEIA